jgi:hypothetical protein
MILDCLGEGGIGAANFSSSSFLTSNKLDRVFVS